MPVIGLLGKPNVGKSTFFKAATLKEVEIAPYPFTTIKANVGIAHVSLRCPHVEIGRACNPRHGFCLKGTRFVPVELLDVAGLIPGAHKGKGLGNQFLDEARRAEVLLLIVDASGKTDAEGNPGEGNPVEEVKFVLEEFDLWLAGIIKKLLQKRGELVEVLSKGLSGLEISREHVLKALERSIPSPENVLDFARELRKIAKPVLIVANKADVEGSDFWIKELLKNFKHVVPASAAYELVLRTAAKHGYISYVPGSSDFEVLKDLSKKQEEALEKIREFLKKYGSTGVQEAINRAVFELANYIAVFPVEDENSWTDAKGNVLPDCFLLKKGSTARDLAYRIHTELGEGFIRAVDARNKKIIGADYVLKHRDVIKIIARR